MNMLLDVRSFFNVRCTVHRPTFSYFFTVKNKDLHFNLSLNFKTQIQAKKVKCSLYAKALGHQE